MRQDKDRVSKWLVAHHGGAILALTGVTGFRSWKPLQPETVAPRRLPDGLLEVSFPDTPEPVLVLVEIETYPDSDADRQVLEDLMLIAVDRKVVSEVVSLILKPKGNLTVTGASERTSRRGTTRVGGSWPVVRLWDLEADALLAAGDAGLIPWVPLARTHLSPDELMTRCRDRLAGVPDPSDRAGLMAVTQILAGLAFPDRNFLTLFGGPEMMIDSPILDEVKEILRKRYEAEGEARGARRGLQEAVLENLETRFGAISAERVAPVRAIADEARLKELIRVAITCADLDAFMAALATGV
jgi:predicted transposase YdaD